MGWGIFTDPLYATGSWLILTNITVTLSELPFLIASLAIILHAVSNRKETGSKVSFSGFPGERENKLGD